MRTRLACHDWRERRMIRAGMGIAIAYGLMMAGGSLGIKCYATPQDQQEGTAAVAGKNNEMESNSKIPQEGTFAKPDLLGLAADDRNALGMPLLNNLLTDQEAIWTSPAHLRWADGSW